MLTQFIVRDFLKPAHADEAVEADVNESLEPLTIVGRLHVTVQKEHWRGTTST